MNKTKKIFNLKFLSQSLAIIGGGVIGYVIGNGIGLVLGAIIAFFAESILAKALKKTPSNS